MKFVALVLIIISWSIAQSSASRDSVYLPLNQIDNLNELRQDLDEAFNDLNFANATWGVSIQSLENGETLYKLNQEKLFVPASLVKLFTTSTALLLLGSDYTYATEFYTDGKIVDGILEGNLYVVGSGDPTIYVNMENKKNRLSDWVDSLKQIGITSIRGNLIGDDRHHQEEYSIPGWLAEYDNNWFAQPSGAFCLNNNSVLLEIQATDKKHPAEFSSSPVNHSYEILNKVITVGEKEKTDIEIIHKPGSNLIRITGKISDSDNSKKFFLPVKDPTHFFVNTLYNYLVENDIEITGHVSDLDLEELSKVDPIVKYLFKQESQKLSLIVEETNKNSNNFYSEQILKTIGYEIYGYGSRENGITGVKSILDKMGVNKENISIVDGSGLSFYNLVSPTHITKLLTYMYKSDEFESFYNSLSLAGFSGTLATRMNRTDAENNFRGKSGYLKNARALAGYIKTADGEPLAVSLIVNNFLVPSQLANYIQDKVCNRLANFTRN